MIKTCHACALVSVVALSAACPPPFATLPFDAGPLDGEGEGEGAGEGEGEGEGNCRDPAAGEPWQVLDIDVGTETEAGALASDGIRLFAALQDGRVFAIDDNGTSSELALCITGPDGAQTAVRARRMFVVDGVLVVSGAGGVCIVDIATGDEDMVAIASAEIDVAAVPLDVDGLTIVAMFGEGASFRFETRARTGVTLAPPVIVPGDDVAVPGGGAVNEIDAIATARGPLFADEAGHVFFVDPDEAPAVSVVANFTAELPRGLIMGSSSADIVHVAHKSGGALRYYRVPFELLLSGMIVSGADLDDDLEIDRSRELFPYDLDSVESVAVRADGARLDSGQFGYVTFTPAFADAAFPLGSEVRVANILGFGALDDESPIWSLSTNAATLTFWRRASVVSGVWTTTVDAADVPAAFGLRTITPLRGDRALVTAGNSLVLATVIGESMTFDVAQNMGNEVAGIDGIAGVALSSEGDAVVVANVAGDVFLIDLVDPTDANRVDGVVDVDAPTTNFDLAIVGDVAETLGNDIAFFAGGLFDGVPGVKHCLVARAEATLTCDAVPVALNIDATPPFEMSRLVNTSGGLLALSNRGASMRQGGIFDAIEIDEDLLVDFDADGALDTPFAGGGGEVVDLGQGCVALFGFSSHTFALDASGAATVLDLDELLPIELNPFMTNAVRLSSGEIVGGGGFGNAFYSITYDAELATCAQRFASATVTVLPPERPLRGPQRAAFFGCDAVVADELGNVWRMDLDR